MTEAEVQNESTEGVEPTESAEGAEAAERVRETPVNPKMKWYVVNTYSGYENRAKISLEERIKQHKLEAAFGEILIKLW